MGEIGRNVGGGDLRLRLLHLRWEVQKTFNIPQLYATNKKTRCPAALAGERV